MYSSVDVKSKKILSMKVTDEYVHDGKSLPKLVEDIVKSKSMTTIGKLFADDAYMMVMIFLDICPQTTESCIVSNYERMLELDGKKGASLETCQPYPRKIDLLHN
jgi:hypothetical protein